MCDWLTAAAVGGVTEYFFTPGRRTDGVGVSPRTVRSKATCELGQCVAPAGNKEKKITTMPVFIFLQGWPDS